MIGQALARFLDRDVIAQHRIEFVEAQFEAGYASPRLRDPPALLVRADEVIADALAALHESGNGTTRKLISFCCQVRFSNRPVGVKHFQTIHRTSVDVARGLALLFGIGTGALPAWDSRTRWNNLSGGLAVRRTAGPSDQTNSPHPSSREGHRSTALVELEFPPIAFNRVQPSCGCGFPGPAELAAVDPYAVHDHSQPACQCHDRLFHPAAPGDLYRPGLEPGPSL
jgi:hypothetical protein